MTSRRCIDDRPESSQLSERLRVAALGGGTELGATLASEEPLGRIRHHPGRLAATITACARFGDHRRPGRDEDNNVRTFL